ncbi:MAG: amidase family protein, partial [Psychrobacter sp.]|nr:amidase family protein [Psychrobacter sp.]
AFTVYDIARRFGKAQVAKIEPQTRNMAMIGRSLTAMDLLKAKQGWYNVQYQTGLLLEQYDMILCPTVPTPAIKHGILPTSKLDEALIMASRGLNKGVNVGKFLLDSGAMEKLSHPILSKMAYTMLGNITGLPAMSVPLGMSKKGLPIGMQFIGRMTNEETLFSLAGEMERAGWFTKAQCEL